MNEQDVSVQAALDQWRARFRDRAQACKEIHDQYMRAGFSPDHAMELLHRDLDNVEGWCHEDD